MLYMLGALTFDTRPFNVDGVEREATASIARKPLLGTADGAEFTGEGEDKLTLTGQLLPSRIGGMTELELAHSMRRQGARFPVSRGDGYRFPHWYAIARIRESHKDLTRDGVGFTLTYTIELDSVPAEAGDGQQIIRSLLNLFGVN
ncbi:phage tail protein [Amorphus orientalis]|uniref:Phage protein U n=1 Tax=Amorphus orientalis TaxID=649198 RepID=A0AAE4ATC5_9HYPH|nr:phage tail protein [Amorphus orientalis]MDQ0314864.1 phage protein U [Amorphus orientalis]